MPALPREADWSALDLDADPTPGDPARIREVIAAQDELVRLADTIDSGLTEVKNTSGGAFVGKTGDALREVIDGHLRKFVSTFREAQQDVQGALRTYQAVMEEQQGRADTALQQAKGLAEDDEEGRASLKSTAKDAGEIQRSASKTAASTVRAAGQKIASPVDACDEIMKALSWLAIILIIPAIIFGGPIALFAIALNVAIFIKTAVDFANGDASALDLLLSGLGMIAPSTRGIQLAKVFQGLRGLASKGITGIKTAFDSFKNVFTGRNMLNLSIRLFFGTADFARGAASWSRGLNGLFTHTPFSHIPGFGGRIFTGMGGTFHIVAPFKALPMFLPQGLTGLHFAGALAYGAVKGIGTGAKWIGSGLAAAGRGVWNGLSGFKALRLVLPVDAAEIQALGIGKALKIGFIDRGVFGEFRYGALDASGRLLGGAGPIHHLADIGGGPPSVHIDPVKDLAMVRSGGFAGPGTFTPSLSMHGAMTPPSMHFDGSLSGLGSANLSLHGLGGGLPGGLDLPAVHIGGLDGTLSGLTSLGHPTGLGQLPTAGPVTHLSPPAGLHGSLTGSLPSGVSAPVAPGGVTGLGTHGLGSVSAGHFGGTHGLGDLGNIGSGARIADVPAMRMDVPSPTTAVPHAPAAGLVDLGHVEAPAHGIAAPGALDLHTGSLAPPPTVSRIDLPATGGHTSVPTPSVGRIEMPAAGTAASDVAAPGQLHLPAHGSVTPGPVHGLGSVDLTGAVADAGRIADVGTGTGRGLGAGLDTHGITPPAFGTHGITPPAAATDGITPPAVSTGITPPAVQHGVAPPPATHGITPPATGDRLAPPPAVNGTGGRVDLPGAGTTPHVPQPAAGGTDLAGLSGLGERAVPTPAPGHGALDVPTGAPGRPVEAPAVGAGSSALETPKLPDLPGAGVPGHGTPSLDGATAPALPHTVGSVEAPGAGAIAPHGPVRAPQADVPLGGGIRPGAPHAPAPAVPHAPPRADGHGPGVGSGGDIKGKAPAHTLDNFAQWREEALAKADVFRKPGDTPAAFQARREAWTRVQQARIDYHLAQNELDLAGARVDGPSTGPSVGEQALNDFKAAEQSLADAKDGFRAHGLDPDDIGQKLQALDNASLKARPRLPGGTGGRPPVTTELPGQGGVLLTVSRTDPPKVTNAADASLFKVHGTPQGSKFTVEKLDAPDGNPVRSWHYVRLGGLRPAGEDFVLHGGLFDGSTLKTSKSAGSLLDSTGHSWPARIDGDDVIVASPAGPQHYTWSGAFHDAPTAPAPHTTPPPPAAGLSGDAAANWGKHVDLARIHLDQAVKNSEIAATMRDVIGGSFTSKRGFGGFVDPMALEKSDLVGKTQKFHQVTQDLLFSGPNERVTVYRGVSMDPASQQADVFIERLPISTSNTFEFQPEWAKNGVLSNRIVFEIDVPAEHGKLAMSYPPHYEVGAGDPPIMSPGQWEVTLPPTTLIRTGEPRIEGGLTVVPVRAEQITPDRFAAVIGEKWPGLPSGTAFDDFGRAFAPESLGRWGGGFENVTAHAAVSQDGLVHTTTVSKPGYADDLTITVTHQPEKNTVAVTFTDAGGSKLLDKSWSGDGFRYIAADLQGNVLHNAEEFANLPTPESWKGKPDTPTPGTGSRPTGAELDAIWARESAARADVFRKPGDTDAIVHARMDAWNDIQHAQAELDHAQLRFDTEGTRIDGSSRGPAIGEQTRTDLDNATAHLNDAKNAFRAHGMNPDEVATTLDDLLNTSLKERPRLLGGASGAGAGRSLGRFDKEIPGLDGAVVHAPRGEAPQVLDAAAADHLVVHGGPADRQFTVQQLDAPGGSPVRSWHYSRGLGLSLTGEDIVLRGGPFDGSTISTQSKLGKSTAAPLDSAGHHWPVKIDGDTLTIASPTGPQHYTWSGAFHDAPTAPAPHTTPPPPAAGLSGKAAENWGSLIDVARIHLGHAVAKPEVSALMRDVIGGAFTSKRGFGGFVNPSALEGGSLLTKVQNFHRITQDLQFSGPNKQLTVYRGVSMDPASQQADVFIERLPISTSNTFDFQPEWAKNGVLSNRVVFEIEVPADHGKLAMSYPPHYEVGAGDPPPRSPDQWEITLAPTTLVRTGEPRIESGLTVVPVRAEAISPDDFASVIKAEWPGLPSGTAFDDFGRAFAPESLGRWNGFENVTAHAAVSQDGLVHTTTVSKPGYADDLTITVTHQPERNTVGLAFTDPAGTKLLEKSWSGTGFTHIAADLRGHVLHNAEEFANLPTPESWKGKPDTPTPGTGSRPTGAELDAIWARESAARADVFRKPGDTDAIVHARMDAWNDIQHAQAELDHAQLRFDTEGTRIDGSSRGPAIGEQTRTDLDNATAHLNDAKNAFRAHGMNPDEVATTLDDLLNTSLKERPRLLGGASHHSRPAGGPSYEMQSLEQAGVPAPHRTPDLPHQSTPAPTTHETPHPPQETVPGGGPIGRDLRLTGPDGMTQFRFVHTAPDGTFGDGARVVSTDGSPVPDASVSPYGDGLRVETAEGHQVFDATGRHTADAFRLADGSETVGFLHGPPAGSPAPTGPLHAPDGRPVPGTEVAAHGDGFRVTDSHTVRVFDGSGTLEFRATRLQDAPGTTTAGQSLRVYEHGALDVLDTDLQRADGLTATLRPDGGFRVEGADGGFRLFDENGGLTHHVTVDGTTFHVSGGDGHPLYDAVQLSDAVGTRFLPDNSGRLLDANLSQAGTVVTRQADGGFRVDGSGPLHQGEFTTYRADGSLHSMRINVVENGTVKQGHAFELDFPAASADDAAKATWHRITPARSDTSAGASGATTSWFDSGTIADKGLGNGRVQLLSHSGAEVFERRPLPGGGFLDAHRPTGTATFGRFTHQRTDWNEVLPDGTAGRHGSRHFGESGRSWFDMADGVRVRHWRENPDGGHVLADLDRSPLTQGFGGDATTWHRYDADHQHLAQGSRSWSPGRGWTDTMTNPRTGATDLVHEKFGRFHLPDDNRRYLQFAMDADGTLKRDWVSYSAHGKENGSGKVIEDGGFLETHRVTEQRPPVWTRRLLSTVDGHTFGNADWLTSDSGFQLHTWKHTPAGAAAPTSSGVRLVGRDSSTLDIAMDGSIVRGTRPLSHGATLTVGDVPLPANVRAQDGYLPWSEGEGGLQGHRTFRPGDFRESPAGTGHGELRWQDRHTVDPPGGDWYTPHPAGSGTGGQEWHVIREGFADGTVVEYRHPPRPEGATDGAGAAIGRADIRTGGDWTRFDHQGSIVGRKDSWPSGADGTFDRTITAEGPAGSAKVAWVDAATGERGVRVRSAGGGTGRYWDAASYQDFDAAGQLVRDHRLLGDGTHVDAWRVAGEDGAPTAWHWNKVDKDGHLMEFGGGPGDRVRTWTDAAGNRLGDWQPGARWSDHVGGADGQVIQEIPAAPKSGSAFQDLLGDTPVRVREYQETPTGTHTAGEWKEFEAGGAVRTRTRLDDGTFLESDEWNKQWRRFGGADGHTLLSERTMSGYVWERDSFGRMTLVGRENDFRGWLTEFRGNSRMLREPNRSQWSGHTAGESLYTPFVQKAGTQMLVEFAQEFTLDFVVGLIVNAIAAEISGRDFTWTDVAKAAFGAAVGSTVKIGVTGLHGMAGRGGALKTGVGNLDSGRPFARPPHSDDTWASEWAGNEKVTRWRAGTYDFSVGITSGLVSGFVSGAAGSAIFGVYDADGNVVHLSGTDALTEGGIGMASGLVGGISMGAAKTALQHSMAGRFYHRQGFTDLFLVGGISKFADKMLGGLIITPTLRADNPPDWRQPDAAAKQDPQDPHPPQESTG
ncbi:hypothetical protein [Streptomyces pinistramenti]|uniref:hypothetical protein n=1 Tax=Streptomyces pinistramenti TaxID=2884812 RepID=UPI001D076D32|nr:hypothetical protein [Streptomyces pinistramenti]MCB5909079.1 hypothetical protein [Streptomyces pinistramenti]